MQQPKIVEVGEWLLAGLKMRMSFANDRTSELWRSFRTREAEIKSRVGSVSFSVKVYDPGYSFSSFDPASEFDKWAGAEIESSTVLTGGFEVLRIPSGVYAVFLHNGIAVEAPRTFGFIFGSWLPGSEFELDQRPHFEVLPKGYNPFDPDSQEEVWIPIRRSL